MQGSVISKQADTFQRIINYALSSRMARRRAMTSHTIEAGLPQDVCPESGEWLYVDVGFSSERKSCGVLADDDAPKVLTFAEASDRIIAAAALPEAANTPNKATLNLLIEAPLSVAFNKRGNPTERIFERLKERQRYWYVGGGCVVMTAAMYLRRALHDSKPRRKVRLFEGFVSFKPKGQATSHREDVEALRAVVLDRLRPPRHGARAESIGVHPLGHGGLRLCCCRNEFRSAFGG
jgi:hypothetical protein